MRFLRDQGLTLALLAVFLLSLVGMLIAGWLQENALLAQHGVPQIGILTYSFSTPFLSALFENWESEFLQMSAYVIMTAMLFQRGSSESKDPDEPNSEEADPSEKKTSEVSPWPIRTGGMIGALYSYSLGIALVILFVVSFVFHWLASVDASNQDAIMHNFATRTAMEYLFEPQLWFESFQNWQSEFLSTAVLVVLSIFLRYRGSPESKEVTDPHSKTGH